MIEILTAAMWVAGAAFALLASVGLLRMPDVFTRMQASTKASTLGLGCLLLGAALQLGDFASFIRVLSIGAFILLTTPVPPESSAPRSKRVSSSDSSRSNAQRLIRMGSIQAQSAILPLADAWRQG